MASKHKTYLKDSVLNASDLIHDFSCSLCKDENLNTEAKYYCGDCSKYYCEKCLRFHAKVHKEHVVLGSKDVDKWVGQGGAIVTCDRHPPKVVEMMCEDHAELCCHLCVSLNHRMCRSITLISDHARGIHKLAAFKQLPASLTKVTASLNKFSEARMRNQNTLKISCHSMLTKIKALRTSLNQLLDELEKRTVEEIENVLADLNGSLQKDIDSCKRIHDQLNALLDTVQAQAEDSEPSSFIGYRKCQDKMAEANRLLQMISTKQDVTVTFQPETRVEQLLATLKTLGNIQVYPQTQDQCNPSGVSSSGQVIQFFDKTKVFKKKGKNTFTVKLKSDIKDCKISGITELPGGEIVLVDTNNRKAKVLASKCKITSHCDLPDFPWDICSISDQEVAVAVDCGRGVVRHEVHFLTFSNGTIRMTRKFSVDHDCYSISHHVGLLYVASGTALYLYTTTGRLMKKIHEDTSKRVTVGNFDLSTDRKSIFILASDQNKLVTLDNDGKILATLHDPDFNWPIGVHVSGGGHVFVCSSRSHTVVQVDQDFKKKLTTLVREGDGINTPRAVWHSARYGRLIVGGIQNDILVVELQ